MSQAVAPDHFAVFTPKSVELPLGRRNIVAHVHFRSGIKLSRGGVDNLGPQFALDFGIDEQLITFDYEGAGQQRSLSAC